MKTKSLGGCAQPLWIVASVLAAGAGVTACGGGGAAAAVEGCRCCRCCQRPLRRPRTVACPRTCARSEPRSVAGQRATAVAERAPTRIDRCGGQRQRRHLRLAAQPRLCRRRRQRWPARTISARCGDRSRSRAGLVLQPRHAVLLHRRLARHGLRHLRAEEDDERDLRLRLARALGHSDLSYYAAENALAVSQDSVVGKWANTDTQLRRSACRSRSTPRARSPARRWACRVGVCSISGTVTQAQPGTSKNMYGFKLNAVDAATDGKDACKLDALPYKGPAAIVLVPAGNFDSNGYLSQASCS
jgi:hypothetical protein